MKQLARTPWAGGAELDIERARDMIARCVRVDDAKDLKDKATAVAIYLRTKKASQKARDDAYEIALRSERRLGQLMAEAGRGKGRPKKVETDDISERNQTLAEAGISRDESARAKKLAAIPEREFDARVQTARETNARISANAVLAKASSPTHDGDEWMTPTGVLELVRKTLGGIDLDPASSDLANQAVKAHRYFTAAHDGLKHSWKADSVFCNPPFSRVEEFSRRLLRAFEQKEARKAVLVVNNATETAWFQELLAARIPVVLPRGRISFVHPNGEGGGANRQGQAIFLFGIHPTLRHHLASLGPVLTPAAVTHDELRASIRATQKRLES